MSGVYIRKLDANGFDSSFDIDAAEFPNVSAIENYLTAQNQTILGYMIEYYNGRTISPKFKGYVVNERTSSISGPFYHDNITAIATKDNSSEMYCVTESRELKKTNLLKLNDSQLSAFSDPFTVKNPFDASVLPGVVLSENGAGFSYSNKYMAGPFTEPTAGPGLVKNPLYFKESYLARSETNWIHLGDEHSEKQIYRVDLSFHKNSCGHLWLYVKNDEGLIKGQYKGMLKPHMKVFTNMRGRRFKIQMMIATHYNFPWAMREMSIGHLYGKSF